MTTAIWPVSAGVNSDPSRRDKFPPGRRAKVNAMSERAPGEWAFPRAVRARTGTMAAVTDIDDDVEEDYLSKSPASGRIGKAAELLVAAVCILATGGELNASASFVDDEGVDLVLHRRGSSAMLAVQIKCRTSAAQLVRRGRFAAQVRSQTLRARDDLDMLFVVVDAELGAITTAWLVPSTAFEAAASRTADGHLRFRASLKQGSNDQWSPYRFTARQLPGRVLNRLAQIEQARSHG